MKKPTDCPCSSGKLYVNCCKPLHDGDRAKTAEALMRSRYSAYVLNDARYLYRSWHPNTRPSLQSLRKQSSVQWIGLQVLTSEKGREGDVEGWVSFAATWVDQGLPHTMRERSYFTRDSSGWVYVSGESLG